MCEAACEIASPVVLVAEDEVLTRVYLTDALLEAGFLTFEAGTADDALAILRARDDVDALVTDIEMPGSMTGLVLAEIARANWPHLAIIVLSGCSLPDGYALPERSFFHPKPCNMAALLSQLRSLVNVSRPLRADMA